MIRRPIRSRKGFPSFVSIVSTIAEIAFAKTISHTTKRSSHTRVRTYLLEDTAKTSNRTFLAIVGGEILELSDIL
jgi:hypothetical protein